MPYTLPLREVPSFPAAHSKIVKPTGEPSTEFLTFLRELEEYLDRLSAAAGEGGTEVLTVATLPPATGKTGVRYMVSDANATTFMSTVAGGGANVVPVVSNGTVWKIG